MRCETARDCYFFQECTDHWSGICFGACEVSNWFKSIVFFACASAAIAAYFCFRCNADRLSNFVAGTYHDFAGFYSVVHQVMDYHSLTLTIHKL